jgi:hypothetical protein
MLEQVLLIGILNDRMLRSKCQVHGKGNRSRFELSAPPPPRQYGLLYRLRPKIGHFARSCRFISSAGLAFRVQVYFFGSCYASLAHTASKKAATRNSRTVTCQSTKRATCLHKGSATRPYAYSSDLDDVSMTEHKRSYGQVASSVRDR